MDRDPSEHIRIDPRLTKALHHSNAALNYLRPGQPASTVTDEDIRAGRAELSHAVSTLERMLAQQARQPGRAPIKEQADQELLAHLQAASDAELLEGDLPTSPEARSRLVIWLQRLAVAVASALLGLFLETVAGALGATAALAQATVQGTEWVQDLGGQLTQLSELLPALATPVVLGTSFLLLQEAGELRTQLLLDPASTYQDPALPETPLAYFRSRPPTSPSVPGQRMDGPAARFARSPELATTPGPTEHRQVVVKKGLPAGPDPREAPDGRQHQAPRDAGEPR